MRPLALLALVLAAAFPGSAFARKPCAGGKHEKVVAKTKSAVVVTRGTGLDGKTYRGCLKSVDRWRKLYVNRYDGYNGSAVGLVALGGRYAALSVFNGDHYNAGTTTIEVVNLHTGHRRSTLFAASDEGNLGGYHAAVTALAISSHATLGWILAEYYQEGPDDTGSQSSVVGHDHTGTRVLDTADYTGLTGLAFSGTKLIWDHDDQPRSAQLADR